jgi:hypothetical protein
MPALFKDRAQYGVASGRGDGADRQNIRADIVTQNHWKTRLQAVRVLVVPPTLACTCLRWPMRLVHRFRPVGGLRYL